MKHYIKQRLRESLLNEELSDEDKIINLLKTGNEINIEIAYGLGEGQGINIDELVKSIYGILLTKSKGKTIKDRLLYLPNLKELWLNDYDLTSLPEGIENLTNLWGLYLQTNKLTSLKGTENLTNLKELYLNNNELTSLPEGIDKLTNLKRLYLRNNELTSLEGIDKLTNLKELHLRNNELTTLKGIDKLTNLVWLRLGGNQLESLPEGIGNLTNLKELYLQDNPISGPEKARLKKIFGNKVIF